MVQSPAIIEWLEEHYPGRGCCRQTLRNARMCARWQRSSAATSIR